MQQEMRKIFIVFCLFALSVFHFSAQDIYRSYIDNYKGLAIDQMKRYGIPASITLAQGLLESSAGRSDLSLQANNHFGIKCGGTWNGPFMLKDDDRANEKFRVYTNPAESYEDHSKFLTTRPRYAFLFKLPSTDYTSWAYGLKQAGYATNPNYAGTLISIIQKYDLSQYDTNRFAAGVETTSQHHRWHLLSVKVEAPVECRLNVNKCNDNYYVVVRPGDTFETISKETGVSVRKLRKYNEVDKKYQLRNGDIVYLEKKRSRADKHLQQRVHTISEGESLYTIAQSYGIQLKALYKNNNLPADYHAAVGEHLYIR